LGHYLKLISYFRECRDFVGWDDDFGIARVEILDGIVDFWDGKLVNFVDVEDVGLENVIFFVVEFDVD
jgi:hypothetical protein